MNRLLIGAGLVVAWGVFQAAPEVHAQTKAPQPSSATLLNSNAPSGIRGKVVEGPIAPTNQVTQAKGGYGKPMQKPTPQTAAQQTQSTYRPLGKSIISVRPANGGAELARKTTDEDGRFEIPLKPGRYLVVPMPPPPRQPPPGKNQLVLVNTNAMADIIVTFDPVTRR